MPLLLEKCNDSDFERVFELVSLAFAQEHPYINVVFPHHETPSGRLAGATRLREGDKLDPDGHFFKVTDTQHRTEGGAKIIAVAKWNVYDGHVPPAVELDGPWWDNGKGDKAYAQEMFRAYLGPRRKAILRSGGNLVSLDLMVVDPAEQGQGAGKFLMHWGVKRADELNVKAVIEATDQGRCLYQQYGFQHIKTYVLGMPEPWKFLPMQRFH